MKTGLRFAIAAAAALTATSTALAAGCSSSSTGDGAAGATSSQYCSALASYASKCSISDPCTEAILQDCSAYAGVYSSAWLSAVTPCASALTCADGGGPAAGGCLNAVASHPAPTAAQLTLAQDYCAKCATAADQTVTECTQAFYTPTADGGIGGVGNLYLDYNDAIVASIDAQCVSPLAEAGVLACDVSLLVCANEVISRAYSAPAACSLTTPNDAGGLSLDGGL